MRGETSYGDSVVAIAQAREPPEPLVFTEAAIEEATGEPAPTVRSIETLFTCIGPAPGLRACESLQELTLMNARLDAIPTELQYVRATLERLSLAGNAIGRIEHLGGMVRLTTLFLHENRIMSARGLGGCPALQRLWLSSNQLASLDGLAALRELRELWLQDNPISRVPELAALPHLQVARGTRAPPSPAHSPAAAVTVPPRPGRCSPSPRRALPRSNILSRCMLCHHSSTWRSTTCTTVPRRSPSSTSTGRR